MFWSPFDGEPAPVVHEHDDDYSPIGHTHGPPIVYAATPPPTPAVGTIFLSSTHRFVDTEGEYI